jgi:uncharacterized linocin/CFP29 family protein
MQDSWNEVFEVREWLIMKGLNESEIEGLMQTAKTLDITIEKLVRDVVAN